MYSSFFKMIINNLISTIRSTLKKWLHLLQIQKFELNNFLSSEQEQLHWLSEGLPSDYLSLQNAVIISQVSF